MTARSIRACSKKHTRMPRDVYAYGPRIIRVWARTHTRMAREAYAYDQGDIRVWPRKHSRMVKDTQRRIDALGYAISKSDAATHREMPARPEHISVTTRVRQHWALTGRQGQRLPTSDRPDATDSIRVVMTSGDPTMRTPLCATLLGRLLTSSYDLP